MGLLVGLASFAAGMVLAASGSHGGLVEEGWLVAVAGIGGVALARGVAPATTSRGMRWRRRGAAARPAHPEMLQRLVTLVELGLAGEFELHYRVRPLLVETAAGQLRLKRSIDLASDPAAAAAALGPEAWELLRPDRPEPPDRGVRGSGAASIRQVVEALERL